MQDWTDGYVAEVGYTHAYFGELNPQRSRLALLVQGLMPPQLTSACEGC